MTSNLYFPLEDAEKNNSISLYYNRNQINADVLL